MGRQEDVWRTLGGGIDFANRQRLAELDQSRSGAANPHPLTCLQLGPIMHANGQWGMLLRFLTCHPNVLLTTFVPIAILKTIENAKVQTNSLIGAATPSPRNAEMEHGHPEGSHVVH